MEFLRKAAKTWVAKFLLALLVLSFGVWGISGSIFTAGGNSVVTVGETHVDPISYRLAYDRQLSVLSQQFGTRLTSEQARAFGIENQVLAQVVAGAVLDEQARLMNLGLSDDRLAGLIAEDPAFQGLDGRFDRTNFSAVLRSVGMSEDDYVRNRAQVAVRAQIIEALADGFKAPDTLLSAIAEHRGETRSVEYVLLSEAVLDPPGEPDPVALNAYFEANRARYRAPEYRKIAYAALTAEALADPDAVAEEVVRADFERNTSRYRTPERRTIDQLTFETREEAEQAAGRLAEGTPFGTLVEEAGISAADIRLGTFRRDELPDPAIAEAAYSISTAGQATGVVDGLFGPVILRVVEIQPEMVRAYEEAAQEIRAELALIEANDILLDVRDAYEDARAGGQTFEEAVRAQRLEPVIVEAIDRSGLDAAGEPVNDLPVAGDLLSAAFEAAEGEEILPLAIGNAGFVLLDVIDVTPERERSLDEIRTRVVADYQADQTARALGELAESLVTRMRNGEELSDIATELGLAVESKQGLTRASEEDAVFGPDAILSVFSGPNGLATSAPDRSGTHYVLMTVTEVLQSAASQADALDARERDAIGLQMTDDLLDQMVIALQEEFGVRVNRSLAEQALSF